MLTDKTPQQEKLTEEEIVDELRPQEVPPHGIEFPRFGVIFISILLGLIVILAIISQFL